MIEENDGRNMLTVNQAAEYLGVSRIKISQLLKNGTLQSESNPLDTRMKLIKREDLDKLKQLPKAQKKA